MSSHNSSQNGQIIRLFYNFLKEHKLFNGLYTIDRRKNPNYGPTICNLEKSMRVWDYWVDYAESIILDYDKEATLSKLILSQLWRFYLLEHIDEIEFDNDKNKENLIRSLRKVITNNGYRNSEGIKALFAKHNITYRIDFYL